MRLAYVPTEDEAYRTKEMLPLRFTEMMMIKRIKLHWVFAERDNFKALNSKVRER